ncbi:MAG: DinB family protein [Ardenticatenales bacterium]
MPHPIVQQLRFTRSEFQRAVTGVTPEEAARHFGPMNCIGWIVGHLAWQEQMYWLTQAQGRTPAPEVNACANGQPMSTPPFEAMWAAWHAVVAEVDAFIEPLDDAALLEHTRQRTAPHEPYKESNGTRLLRTTYHYWYHMGELQAIRQMLGHTGLPSFVGAIGDKAPFAVG